MTAPNLIERMENLIAALDNARTYNGMDTTGAEQAVEAAISDAEGIAGEILTMIDGR